MTGPKKLSFMEEFTPKLSNKSEQEHDAISKVNRNANKGYTDGSRMAEGNGIKIYGPRIIYFET